MPHFYTALRLRSGQPLEVRPMNNIVIQVIDYRSAKMGSIKMRVIREGVKKKEYKNMGSIKVRQKSLTGMRRILKEKQVASVLTLNNYFKRFVALNNLCEYRHKHT